MIALNKVRPGDILLVSGQSKASPWIRTFTGGKYSHAAIFITNKVLFEAIGSGLGFTLLEAKNIGWTKNGIQLSGEYSGASRFKIMRYNELNTTPNETARILIDCVASWFGLNYPRAYELVKTNPFVRKFRSIFKLTDPFRSEASSKSDKSLVEGTYCSKLVLTLLEALGYQSAIYGNDVSPNRLGRLDKLVEQDCTSEEVFPSEELEETLSLFKQNDRTLWGLEEGHLSINFLADKFYDRETMERIVSGRSKEAIQEFLHDEAPHVDHKFMLASAHTMFLMKILLHMEDEWSLWCDILDDYEKGLISEDLLSTMVDIGFIHKSELGG